MIVQQTFHYYINRHINLRFYFDIYSREKFNYREQILLIFFNLLQRKIPRKLLIQDFQINRDSFRAHRFSVKWIEVREDWNATKKKRRRGKMDDGGETKGVQKDRPECQCLLDQSESCRFLSEDLHPFICCLSLFLSPFRLLQCFSFAASHHTRSFFSDERITKASRWDTGKYYLELPRLLTSSFSLWIKGKRRKEHAQ